jgi:hypothetical protein
MRRAARLAGGVTAALVLLSPTAAAAADIQDGLWYYNDTGLADIHQTVTGSGVQIALIDSVVNPAAADLVGTALSTHEPSYCAEQEGGPALPATSATPDARHTTSMVSLMIGTGAGTNGEPGVLGVAPGASVRVYAKQIDEGSCPAPAEAPTGTHATIPDAVAEGADIVVVTGTMSVLPEDVVDAVRAGVIVVASAGNDGGSITGLPAAYNGVVATGTVDASGALYGGSPSGARLGVVAPGVDTRSMDPTYSYYGTTSGSSNSAAFTAGALALAVSAFPEATSNQILQALIRSTDGSLHDPSHSDTRGYGAVDIRQLLATEPTTYPDVNPFVTDQPGDEPPAEAFGLVDTEPTQEPSEPSSIPTEGPAEVEPEGFPVLAIAGVAALVVVLIGTATAIVLTGRRRRRLTTEHAHDGGSPHG